jgi:hypothetical protein
MKIKALVLTLASLPLLAATGCATYGPTWSEISGDRYNVTVLNRRPGFIQKVDGYSSYASYPIKVDPGMHEVVLGAHAPGWPGGPQLHTMALDLAPCTRYYLNAQFNNPVSPDWTPVVDYSEPIAGCKTSIAKN